MAKPSAFPPPVVSASGVTMCGGCVASLRCKLGIAELSVDRHAQTITAWATCTPQWEGGPGVAHGAWIAGVFDEVLGTLPSRLDVPCVTADLRVEFISPLTVDEPVVVTAGVDSHEGRRWAVTGELRTVEDGVLIARGTAKLVEPKLDHFTKLA